MTTSMNGLKHEKLCHDESIPSICRFWNNLRRSVPFRVKFFDVDVSFSIASAIFLGVLRYVVEGVIVSPVFGFPSNEFETKRAVSRLISIFHSSNLVPVLFVLCGRIPSYNPSARMIDEPVGQWWKDSVDVMFQFCAGYMLYDTLLCLIWLRLTMQDGGLNITDYKLLCHHLATIFFVLSVLRAKAGHQCLLVGMLLAEATNPVHKLYTVLVAAKELDCCNSILCRHAFDVSEFLFGVQYVTMRAIVAPPVFIHVSYNLLTTGLFKVKELPAWLIIAWVIIIWGIILGSIPWVIQCWSYVLRPLPREVVDFFGQKQPGTWFASNDL